MISIKLNPIVLAKLKSVMPMTDKAERALNKYVSVLELLVEQSLLQMDTNLFRFYKLFMLSTHELSLRVGQFVINGKSQYLHAWLEDNNLQIVKVKEVGAKGKSVSMVALTDLATMVDAMDVNTLRKKKINDLDALLEDKSLSDYDFFMRVFPNFDKLTVSQVKQNYDFCPISIKSLKQYIVWLTHRANRFNAVEKQLLVRHASVILRIASSGDGDLPMLKIDSHFGRTYYSGVSVQSAHKSLREAMLGDCYEYDIRSSVISWKMGFAKQCHQAMNSSAPFTTDFGASLMFLEDKKKFREYIRSVTFGHNHHIADDLQMDLIKQALTALSFGARVYSHGWISQNGKEFNPAIVKIIKDEQARKRFINDALMKQFIEEQKKLDAYIYGVYTKQTPSLLTDKELQTSPNRPSKSKIMAYLYQHAETFVMNIVRNELKLLGVDVIANVHDAIFVRKKLSSYNRENIEWKMRDATGIEYWYLDFEELKAYKGISDEVRKEEAAHKKFIAEQEKLAKNYTSKIVNG
jgi:hypothetical protein